MAPDSVPGITMRQLAEFTCPAFPQRPRRQSKSSAVHRRTFAELTCWSEFKPGVTSMLSCMDNTERRFRVPDIGGEVDNEEERVDMVADDESEVRGIFTFVFNSVNRMAVRRGCRAAFQGGGLKSSSADGMAYSKDGPPSTDRSSNVLMMLEFKGMWQFELPEDVKGLAEVLETEAGKDLLHTLIQAYGDAVMDETPILGVSNYETTLFLQRLSACSKALRVSPVIYWDGRNGLPLRASCLWALEESERLRSLKPQLARHLVSKTGGQGS
ncbi:hypothetical protein WJX84_003679 [Apatococcus fuscideae]|uniref:Uncharacterized protein n=1 Tax=Apatococcus fuscideae TaxID=2026836 RepID=A0AAW1SLX2_9CHLO